MGSLTEQGSSKACAANCAVLPLVKIQMQITERVTSLTKLTDFFRKTDIVLWLLTAAAVIYSMLLISSMQRAGDYNYLRPQLAGVIVGGALAILISLADYRFLIRRWGIALALGLGLIVLVFLFGIKVSGTDDMAWIALPGGLTFQPSEFIKICFIITFTKHLCALRERQLLHRPLAAATHNAAAAPRTMPAMRRRFSRMSPKGPMNRMPSM